MKFPILLTLMAACAMSAETTFEALDLDEVRTKPSVLGDCLLGKAECVGPYAVLAGRVTSILTSNCGDCTEKERVIVKTVAATLHASYPELVQQLVSKLDPNKEYSEVYKPS